MQTRATQAHHSGWCTTSHLSTLPVTVLGPLKARRLSRKQSPAATRVMCCCVHNEQERDTGNFLQNPCPCIALTHVWIHGWCEGWGYLHWLGLSIKEKTGWGAKHSVHPSAVKESDLKQSPSFIQLGCFVGVLWVTLRFRIASNERQ